jgi:hypothetical protein
MTYNISNPIANPKKLSKIEKKKFKKINEFLKDKSRVRNSNRAVFGKTSNAMQFMQEHNMAKDRCPRSFESWRNQVKPTGTDEDGKFTWSERPKVPRPHISTAKKGKTAQKGCTYFRESDKFN